VIREFTAANEWLAWMTYAAVMGGVLGGGWLRNHRNVARRVAESVVDLAQLPAMQAAGNYNERGGRGMTKILLPVDGSSNALQAVRHVIAQIMGGQSAEVHLLHVRTPLSRHVGRLVSGRDRRNFHREGAEAALKGARELLDRHGVAYACHAELGDKAKTINAVARRLRVDQIVMGTARKHSLTRVFEDAVAHRVLEGAQVPVQIIAGRAVSVLERWGVPAGVGTAIALLLMVEE
jgi:nucleotide-binding universal stress UspA family protein